MFQFYNGCKNCKDNVGVGWGGGGGGGGGKITWLKEIIYNIDI